jgi:DNA-binding transcriptional LysR family regulator
VELYQLRSFVRTAQIGNLTKAAAELHVTQPAVSLQIRSLEDELGEKVFERRGRGLFLTPAGRVLLDRAERMLDLADDARREIAALDGLEHGTIEIGTNDSNCLYVLPDVIRGCRSDFPGVQVHLDNSHSSQVAQWVAEGRVEIGIVTLPVVTAQLESEVLYRREDVLICPPDHPLVGSSEIGPSDLQGYPLLLLYSGSVSHSRLLQALSHDSPGPSRVMHVGSIEVIKRYVEIGLGISVIPRLNAQHEIDSSRLYAKPLEWLPAGEVGVVYRKNGYLSPAARVFLDRLRHHIHGTLAGSHHPPGR